MRLIDGDRLQSDLEKIALVMLSQGDEEKAIILRAFADVVRKQPEIHVEGKDK